MFWTHFIDNIVTLSHCGIPALTTCDGAAKNILSNLRLRVEIVSIVELSLRYYFFLALISLHIMIAIRSRT